MSTSPPLFSEITRGRVVILKDCLFQTDVFNLVMRVLLASKDPSFSTTNIAVADCDSRVY